VKYALLEHVNKEAVDQVDVANAKAAGMAYGEALRAAGSFSQGQVWSRRGQALWYRSVRNGKRQVHDGPYAETKEFPAGSSSSTCQTGMLHRSGQRVILLRFCGSRIRRRPSIDRLVFLLWAAGSPLLADAFKVKV